MHVSLSLSCRLRERNGNGNKNKARECDLQEHKNNYDSKRNEHIYARWLVFTFEIKCEMDIMSVLLMYIVALRVEVLVYLIWLAKCRDTQRVSDSGKIHVHLLPAAGCQLALLLSRLAIMERVTLAAFAAYLLFNVFALYKYGGVAEEAGEGDRE